MKNPPGARLAPGGSRDLFDPAALPITGRIRNRPISFGWQHDRLHIQHRQTDGSCEPSIASLMASSEHRMNRRRFGGFL
jgi:hypothetical protein